MTTPTNPVDPSDRGERFSQPQPASLDLRQADQDRTLAAIHTLEAALGAAAPGREVEWHDAVRAGLATLDEAAAEEAENASRPDSLLSDIARTQPRLRNRVRGLRLQYGHLRESIRALRRELEEDLQRGHDFADLRQRLGWVLSAWRHQRGRESDLIYEAYYEAFHADLPVDTSGQ